MLGIDLTAACRLYHVDVWWNDSKITQASDRVHRIGQTSDVFITHLRVQDTIEVAMTKMIDDKKQVIEVVQGARAADSSMTWVNNIHLVLSEKELLPYKNLLAKK